MRLKREDTGGRPGSGLRHDEGRASRLGRYLLIGSAALALSGAGCARAFFAMPPERATELGNAFDSLAPSQLGFERGRTTLDDAMRMMEGRGMTHIVENTNVSGGADGISVLSADFQLDLHIFRSRRYEQSIRLELGTAELPHRYALRVAENGEGKVIMALARDAAGFEPAMLIFIRYIGDGTLGRPAYIDMSGLERRHNGMQDPLFVGYDLRMGVTFIARDRNGVPWENGYLLSWDGRTLGKTPVPFSELVMCDCVHSWAQGQDGH